MSAGRGIKASKKMKFSVPKLLNAPVVVITKKAFLSKSFFQMMI
jgi:hypothetical protein